MASVLPVVQKQWQRVFNVDSTTDRKKLILDKKNILCGVAFSGQQITSNAWRVVRSSNASTVANSDLWTTTADITLGNAAGTNARSWAILQNALGRQWLWDYRGADTATIFLSMSPSGSFTGGTTTAAPTAADALTKDPLGGHTTYDILNGGKVLQNVLHSVDGKQTVIFTCQASTRQTLWLFGDTEDAPVDWVHPTIMWADGTATDGSGGSFSNHLVGASGGVHITAEETPGVLANVHFVGESIDVNPLQVTASTINVKNGVTNQFDILDKCWLASLRDGTWGQLGYWPDMWPTMPTQTGKATGDHYPADGSRRFVAFNDLVLPWFGAAAMVIA